MANVGVHGSGSDTEAIMKLAKNKHNVKSTTEDAVTLTVTEFMNGVYKQGGTPGTSIKTTPTAALIVAAYPEAEVGSSFQFVISNGGDDTLTLAGGTGVTISGTATVAAGASRVFNCYITNVSTPAVLVCG